jgi:hypothetical protein
MGKEMEVKGGVNCWAVCGDVHLPEVIRMDRSPTICPMGDQKRLWFLMPLSRLSRSIGKC